MIPSSPSALGRENSLPLATRPLSPEPRGQDHDVASRGSDAEEARSHVRRLRTRQLTPAGGWRAGSDGDPDADDPLSGPMETPVRHAAPPLLETADARHLRFAQAAGARRPLDSEDGSRLRLFLLDGCVPRATQGEAADHAFRAARLGQVAAVRRVRGLPDGPGVPTRLAHPPRPRAAGGRLTCA